MAIPTQFFTAESMLTLTGAAGATFVICNGLQRAMNFNPRWLALAIAEALTVFGTLSSHASNKLPTTAADILVAIVNGFLVYATATGTSAIAGGGHAGGSRLDRLQVAPPPRRRLFTPWF